MKDNQDVRDLLASCILGNWAHITFEKAIQGFPPDMRKQRIEHVDHSAWDLVYHLHAAQNDILEFITSDDYREREYPGGYWPPQQTHCSEAEWQEKIHGFTEERDRLIGIVKDRKQDLYAPLPNGSGQNIFREALVIGNHNSYHIAQLIDLRMLLRVPVKDY
jgi:hypothetical protein